MLVGSTCLNGHGSAAAAATAALCVLQVGEQVPRAVQLDARQAAAHAQLQEFRQRAAAAGVNMGQQQPEVQATLVSRACMAGKAGRCMLPAACCLLPHATCSTALYTFALQP